MKFRTGFYILMAGILFLGSCFPSRTIVYESLQPAGFSISPDTDSILVLNISYYPWVDKSESNVLSGLNRSESVIIDTMITRSIFDGLFTVLDNSIIDTYRNSGYSELRSTDTTAFLQPLDLGSVNYLCDEFNTDMIICLEYYGFDFDEKFITIELDMFPQYAIYRNLLWRIYGRDKGMLGEMKDRDTLYFEGSVVEFSNRPKRSGEFLPFIRDCFWYGGEKFGKYLSPGWETVTRNYFNIYYDSENISLDEEGLTRMLEEVQSETKIYRAWYNYAVFLEQNGMPEKALSALDSAILLRPGYAYLKSYRKKLEEEISDKKKLDFLFGIPDPEGN